MGDQLLSDDLVSEEFTFDRAQLEVAPTGWGLSGVGASGRLDGYCRSCTIQARMGNGRVLENGGGQVGVCHTTGCRGYMGHAPAGRPQGEPDLDTSGHSDEVPLLFAPLTSGSNFHSSQEMEPPPSHCHGEESSRDASRTASKRLKLAMGISFLFLVCEALGGYLSGSLAIQGDAVHMLSDVASYLLAIVALWASAKRPNKKYTFGFSRAEPLGALGTFVFIWGATLFLMRAAGERISTLQFEINDITMMIVATCGVVFNIFLFFTLHGGLPTCHLPHEAIGGEDEEEEVLMRTIEKGVRKRGDAESGHQHLGGDHHGHSHGGGGGQVNIKAALFHVLTDFLQSVGVLVSSVLIHFEPSWKLADPLCTLVFGIFALMSTIPTIWNLLKTLLEATPENLSYDEVHETLSKVRGVIGVHSLHLWSLSAPVVCLTVHLTIKLGDDIEGVRTRAAAMVRAKHKINKITIQVETQQQAVEADCLECQPLL